MGISDGPTEDVGMDNDAGGDETTEQNLPKDAVSQIEETQRVLSAARKKRKSPAGYPNAAEVKTFASKHAVPSLHSSSPAGISAFALSRLTPSQFLTGGNDKIVQLYDRDTDKVLATLKGHTKRVNHVAFRERQGEPTLIISGGADKIAKVWSHDSASGEYIPRSTIRTHKNEITGLKVHHASTFLVLASLDKTYSVHDLSTQAQIFRSGPSDEPFVSMSVHPDGILLGLGTPTSTIHIVDIRSGGIAVSLTPTDASPFVVNSLSFSENGYNLAAPESESSVAIWDLRKRKATHSIQLGEAKVNKVLYDSAAQFLGVAGSDGLSIFAQKGWDQLATFEEGGEVSDLAFAEHGREVWGVSGRDIRIWGSPT